MAVESRYEVGSEVNGTECWERTRWEATKRAKRLAAKHNSVAYVFDTMARHGGPSLWNFSPSGEVLSVVRRGEGGQP